MQTSVLLEESFPMRTLSVFLLHFVQSIGNVAGGRLRR